MEGTPPVTLECSVVVPLCDEEQNLPTLHVRLTTTLRRLAIPYEIIYVDDGSRDRTGKIIAELHEQDSAVKGIFLSRNFGHQPALCAGVESAAGRAVITMDGDLQDPPEVIPALIDKWREGYQIVFARRHRRREHLAKRAACFLFYRLLRRLSEVPIPLDTGDFALMDRQAVEELNHLPERTRFVRGLRSWVGFRHTEVEYDRDIRRNGRTKYSLGRLIHFALDGMFAFSIAPLKMITVMGCIVSMLAIAALLACVAGRLGVGPEVADLVWLGSALVLLGGIQLVALGVIGEYLARVYDEVRGRPLYVTRERIGFESLPRPVPSVLDFLPPESLERREKVTAARLKPDWTEGMAALDTNT